MYKSNALARLVVSFLAQSLIPTDKLLPPRDIQSTSGHTNALRFDESSKCTLVGYATQS
jgi:hypothetical protein